MDELIIQKESKGITSLILNRPDKRNALSVSLIDQLVHAFQTLQQDPVNRVVILRGAGKAFCAGLDLNEIEDQEKRDLIFKHISHLFRLMIQSPLIIISAIHGAAFAGALGLVSASDITIGAEQTQFGLQETRRGLVAALIIAMMMRQIRMRDLQEMTLIGDPIDEKRAYEMGWISRIVRPEDLHQVSLSMAESILRGAPEATIRTKRFFHELEGTLLDEGFQKAVTLHASTAQHKEVQEGIHAFLEKRLPYWEVNGQS